MGNNPSAYEFISKVRDDMEEGKLGRIFFYPTGMHDFLEDASDVLGCEHGKKEAYLMAGTAMDTFKYVVYAHAIIKPIEEIVGLLC